MLGGIIQFGPDGVIQLLGIRLVGVTETNIRKLLLMLVVVAVVYGGSRILRLLSRVVFKHGMKNQRIDFWLRQAISLLNAILILVGLVSIWFDNPARLGSALGFLTAGLAFALQRVVTAIAAYFVILRGNNFSVGDRIQMANVRGDVIALGFIQTTVMEMGQTPGEQADPPGMWVHSRQYTGRIVTITNDKIFDEPVYNYSREFPFIWEEMRLPISYKDDRKRAERILLDVVTRHTVSVTELSEEVVHELERRYFMRRTDMGPRVFWRLTDNWIEMTARFITKTHGIRDLKDAISRELMDQLDNAGIGIASGTYEVVGMPPLQVNVHPGGPNGDNGQRQTISVPGSSIMRE